MKNKKETNSQRDGAKYQEHTASSTLNIPYSRCKKKTVWDGFMHHWKLSDYRTSPVLSDENHQTLGISVQQSELSAIARPALNNEHLRCGLTPTLPPKPIPKPLGSVENYMGPMKNIVDNGSSADTVWYTDDDMNLLLNHYLKANEQVGFLDGMLGTDWLDNVLKDNLHQFQTQRLEAIAQGKGVKDRILIPVNLNNNHWVLVYFVFQQDASQSPDVYYFDPLGGEVNIGVKKAIKSQTLYPDLSLVNLSDCVQGDGYNCGPWVIEAAKSIADGGKIPDKGLNINLARKKHRDILRGAPNSLNSSQSHYMLLPNFRTMTRDIAFCHNSLKWETKHRQEEQESFQRFQSESCVVYHP